MVKVSKPEHTHDIDPFEFNYIEYLDPGLIVE